MSVLQTPPHTPSVKTVSDGTVAVELPQDHGDVDIVCKHIPISKKHPWTAVFCIPGCKRFVEDQLGTSGDPVSDTKGKQWYRFVLQVPPNIIVGRLTL